MNIDNRFSQKNKDFFNNLTQEKKEIAFPLYYEMAKNNFFDDVEGNSLVNSMEDDMECFLARGTDLEEIMRQSAFNDGEIFNEKYVENFKDLCLIIEVNNEFFVFCFN